MISPSACRHWQPEWAANSAQQRRCYTAAWDTTRLLGEQDKMAPGARLELLSDHLTYIEQVWVDIARFKMRLEHINDKRIQRGVMTSIKREQTRRLAEIKLLIAAVRRHAALTKSPPDPEKAALRKKPLAHQKQCQQFATVPAYAETLRPPASVQLVRQALFQSQRHLRSRIG